jgi:dTMP kinase
MMGKGIFITFEGSDGSGKSTQVRRLRQHCETMGYKVLFTREPGGTEISEKIRTLILDPENTGMSGEAEALLYAASRAQLVSEVIKPALERGEIVICDRFMDSSIAYQGFGRGLGDGVRLINEFATAGISPDLTFFLDLPPEEGMRRRLSGSSPDRLEREKMEFHRKVYEGYLELSRRYKDRYLTIDASAPIEAIAEKIAGYFDAYVAERNKG